MAVGLQANKGGGWRGTADNHHVHALGNAGQGGEDGFVQRGLLRNVLVIVKYQDRRHLQTAEQLLKIAQSEGRNALEVFSGEQGQGGTPFRGGLPQGVEEGGKVSIALVALIPQAAELALLDIAADKGCLPRSGMGGDPNDRILLPQAIKAFKQSIPEEHGLISGARSFGHDILLLMRRFFSLPAPPGLLGCRFRFLFRFDLFLWISLLLHCRRRWRRFGFILRGRPFLLGLLPGDHGQQVQAKLLHIALVPGKPQGGEQHHKKPSVSRASFSRQRGQLGCVPPPWAVRPSWSGSSQRGC
jgi:hypothetical protein